MTDTASPKTIPGWLKTTLELGPVLLFFAAYLWVKDETYTFRGVEYDGFIVVTAALVPLILLCTAILWFLTGKLSHMQIVTAVIVTVFGGLSVWLNNDLFFKMKPTIVNALFAAALGFGLWRGQSYLSKVLGEAMPLTDEGWMILTRRVVWMFVAMAVANEVVWRTMSTETWVYLETFGLPIAMFAFFMAQAPLIKRYSIEDDTSAGGGET